MDGVFGISRRVNVAKPRSTALLLCFFSLLLAVASAQNAPSAGQQAPAAAPASTSSAETQASAQIPIPQLYSKPRVHVIRLNEAGTGPAPATFAVAGAHATYFGGPVISSVHVVQVIYGSGSFVPNVTGGATPTIGQYFTDIVSSGSLIDMLSEYSTVGVLASDGTAGTNQTIGHGTFDGVFTITPSAANNGATITDSQIQSELLAQVAAGNLPAPVIDGQGNNNTLYMIYFPAGKTINDGTSNSCVKGGFCAYHNSTNATFSSHRLFYGVFPDVQPPSLCSQGCGGGLPFDIMTNVASHELSEAISDADVGPPTTFTRPLAWVDPQNGEIGDICVGQEATVRANATAYTIQTEFSNFQNDCESGPPQLFVPAGNTVTPGQQFDLQVSVQSAASVNLIGYTGTLHFTSSDPKAVLPADYTFTAGDAGVHTFVVSLGTPGAQTITIADTKLPILTAANRPFTVIPSAVSTFSVAEPGNVTQGVAVSVTVAARDSNNQIVTNYSGTLHFSSGDTAAVLPANSTLTNGVGTFSVTFNTVGGQSLVAADSANGSIFGEGGSQVFAPAANPTATTVAANANPSTFGQSVTYTATTTQGGSAAPVGNVTFTADGRPIGSGVVDANGRAALSLSSLEGGPHVIFADYIGGDAAHPPSSSAPLNVVVNPAATTLTLTSSAPSATFGTNLAFSAQVSSPGGVVFGGTVTFLDGTTPLAVVSPNGGFAGFGDNSLSVGTHSITATYSGTASFTNSSAGPLTQVITPAPPADYTITPNVPSATILAGQSAVFQITTKSISGFTGNVTFSCGSLPTLTTCTFTPPTAFVSAAAPTLQTTLVIKTTGPHAQLLAPAREERRNARLWTLSPFALGIMLLAGASRRSRRRTILGVLLGLVLLSALVSCGGGGPPPPPPPPPITSTPAGTSTIVVSGSGSATSGASPANPKQQLNITLTVQP